MDRLCSRCNFTIRKAAAIFAIVALLESIGETAVTVSEIIGKTTEYIESYEDNKEVFKDDISDENDQEEVFWTSVNLAFGCLGIVVHISLLLGIFRIRKILIYPSITFIPVALARILCVITFGTMDFSSLLFGLFAAMIFIYVFMWVTLLQLVQDIDEYQQL